MVFHGKIEVIEEYDEILGIIKADRLKEFSALKKAYPYVDFNSDLTLKTPSVVKLLKHVRIMRHGVKFSRTNVYIRDGFRCAYCGVMKGKQDLNYDHVTPRHAGGRTSWENIVTSCYPCNCKKANRTPEQAGMTLRVKPHKPKSLPISNLNLIGLNVPQTWCNYVPTIHDFMSRIHTA